MISLHFSRCKVAPSVTLFLHIAHFGALSIHKKIFTIITFYNKVGDHHDCGQLWCYHHQHYHHHEFYLIFSPFLHPLHLFSRRCRCHRRIFPSEQAGNYLLNKQATFFELRFLHTNFFHSQPKRYHHRRIISSDQQLFELAKGLETSPV